MWTLLLVVSKLVSFTVYGFFNHKFGVSLAAMLPDWLRTVALC